jgi:hypothetical protein
MQPAEAACTEVPLSIVLLMMFHDGNADDGSSSCINIARPRPRPSAHTAVTRSAPHTQGPTRGRTRALPRVCLLMPRRAAARAVRDARGADSCHRSQSRTFIVRRS